jgi:hypothetical protein
MVNFRGRDNSVGIETGYGLGGRGSIPGRSKILFCTTQRPNRLWDPPSLLCNGYRGLFPWGSIGQVAMLTTQLHLVPRSRMKELYLHFPIFLHSMVLNWLSTGTTLPFVANFHSVNTLYYGSVTVTLSPCFRILFVAYMTVSAFFLYPLLLLCCVLNLSCPTLNRRGASLCLRHLPVGRILKNTLYFSNINVHTYIFHGRHVVS